MLKNILRNCTENPELGFMLIAGLILIGMFIRVTIIYYKDGVFFRQSDEAEKEAAHRDPIYQSVKFLLKAIVIGILTLGLFTFIAHL